MAQGGLKKRSEKFSVASKSKSSRKGKPLGLKKGVRYIAPKKAKTVKAEKLKKTLKKQIGRRIEQEVSQTASRAGTDFRLIQPSTAHPAGKKRVTKKS